MRNKQGGAGRAFPDQTRLTKLFPVYVPPPTRAPCALSKHSMGSMSVEQTTHQEEFDQESYGYEFDGDDFDADGLDCSGVIQYAAALD